MRNRIQVLSPRTWGEFGNFLAATSFTRALRRELDADVTLLEAESILPWLGDIGAEIREITLTSPDSGTRARRYVALMAVLAERFPRGFEIDPDADHRKQLGPLVEHFRQTAPDLVVGTKGLVARLSVAAAKIAGRPRAVVNHVTNPGLLQLAVHRSAHVDLTLVSMPWAKTRLLAAEDLAADRVCVVGPLVAQHDLQDFLTGAGAERSSAAGGPVPWGHADDPRPKIIIFSNRGGEEYLRIVRHLAVRHTNIDLVFVGYDDPDLASRAAAAAEGMPAGAAEGVPGGAAVRAPAGASWRFHTRLTQAQYFDYIDRAARSAHGFLISKAGPNTTLEAAYFGIPVLLLESGLPMESWVSGLIHDHGLGRCCRSADELIGVLDDWLAVPTKISEHKRAAVHYARTALDQRVVVQRIGAAVRGLAALRPGEQVGAAGHVGSGGPRPDGPQ